MIISLYGEDSYRLRQKFKIIVDKYREKNGHLNIEKIDVESSDWLASLAAHLRNRSIFSAKKLTILDINFKEIKSSDLKELKEILKNYLENKDEVIIITSSLALPASFNFLLKAPAEYEKFSKLTARLLLSFIKKEAEDRKVQLTDRGVELLAEMFGSDTWAIATELDKLSLINQSAVLPKGPKYSYYQLINLFKTHRSPFLRLVVLETILSGLKEEPARVFNGLAYGRFFFLPTKEWYQKLADYDVQVKSGRLDYEEALVDLAVS